MAQDSNLFAAELQDDFYTEADEHLMGIRRGLLALESAVNQPVASRSLLDDLFRHFHSLKGLAAMGSLREAEQLAHHMESYLRVLRQDQIVLSVQGLEALIAGTRLLEQVISAHRAGSPAPDISPALMQLAQVIPPPESSRDATAAAEPPSAGRGLSALGLYAEQMAQLAAARTRGARVWRFGFAPTPELSERGVNVTTVRARLQGIGELIHGAPRIGSQGSIAFEFIVASDRPESEFATWAADGITLAELDTGALGLEHKAPAPEAPVAPAEPAATPPAPAISLAPSNVVRVDLARLDSLMRTVGSLVITRAHLEDNLNRLRANMPANDWRALQEVNAGFERQLRDLRDGVMRVRLVPIGEIFERMHFVVRDLAREHGKDVGVELQGTETEIDKLVVERMMDPLLHLVRNAVSHGLETPAERLAMGKRAEGRLLLCAAAEGDTITIQVEDDGRGIDAAEVFAKARALKLVDENETPAASLLDLICLPGFTTRDQADRASGRGIGMSVVKETTEKLGGSVSVETEVGRGTSFTLSLPLTLAILDALIIRSGEQVFAVPLASVREVVEVLPHTLKVLENNEVIPYREGALALLRLARLFGLKERPGRAFHALVVGNGSNAFGILVDRIVGQREIVVHPLADSLVHVPGISGATELGDGHAVLIVDTAALGRLFKRSGNGRV